MAIQTHLDSTSLANHYMQTDAWAEVKSEFGWNICKLPGSTFVYTRKVPTLGNLNYIPGISGITSKNARELASELKKDCPKGFAIRIEPYQVYDEELISILKKSGWKNTRRHVQYRDTILIDLQASLDDILMSFKSRARYEIKQATSFGVKTFEVDTSVDNLTRMYNLLVETSVRNQFYIRDKNFTMAYWHALADAGMLRLYFATHESSLLAGAVIITSGDIAWYKDGGSIRDKSNLMGPRLLLWHAIQELKSSGIKTFDLGGIPAPHKHKESSMRGVYVFKSAFSREHATLMPTMELPQSKRYLLWAKAETNWLRVYNLFAKSLWY